MSLHATDSGSGDFEQPVAGQYIARCYRVIDLGTQPQTFQGKPSSPKPQVVFYFELLADEEGKDYRDSEGKPFVVVNTYTNSTNEKATLRKHIDAWRGVPLTKEQAADYDISKLLNKYCRLQVILKSSADGNKTYVNIASIGSTKMKPAGVNELVKYEIDEGIGGVYETLPQWIKDKLTNASEWASVSGNTKLPVVDGDIVDGKLVTKEPDTIIEDLDENADVDLDKLPF